LLSNVSSHRISGFNSSGSLAVLTWFNEADSGSLALRLTGSLHGASTRPLLAALSVSLHAGRSVRMMNTFQFISLVGGAGAPKDNEANKDSVPPAPQKTFLAFVSFCPLSTPNVSGC
jgi:hypothetical protein